jgi:hypothetical protein
MAHASGLLFSFRMRVKDGAVWSYGANGAGGSVGAFFFVQR